jgi:hypothetical protein
MNRSLLLTFGLLVVVSAAYRVIPYEMRPEWLGAPQLAMALLAGSVIKDRKWAFALPLASMLLSDILMEILHSYYPSVSAGFYSGQLLNYIFILSTTVIGFFISSRKPTEIAGGALAAPVVYFLLSNFAVWLGGGGLQRAKTMSGLLMTYADGLPFLKASLIGTMVFSAVLFGAYQLFSAKKRILAV